MQTTATTAQHNGVCDFKLGNYDAFGFDLDHTLAKYHIQNLFKECYMSLTSYLVKKKNYPSDAFSFKNNFCARGLVLDLTVGNFLKVSESGRILKASHGTRMLNRSQMVSEYGESLSWEHYKELIDTVNNIGDRYRIFDNLFDMPTAVVCAHCIDSLDKQAGGKAASYNIWPDICDAINHAYHPKQFAANKGGFFPKFRKDTGSLVMKCSEEVKAFLRRLKKEDKKLFVLTSSYVDFATASLEYILGDDWQSYFDVNIGWARKPSFFTAGRSFTRLDGDTQVEIPVNTLNSDQFYLTGNCHSLNAHLAQLTGKDNPKVLFFGDSMRSDVYPGKTFAGWDTVLILEELECDEYHQSASVLNGRTDQNENGERSSSEERSKVESCHSEESAGDEPATKRTKLKNGEESASLKRSRFACEDADERNFLTSTEWGSLFFSDYNVGRSDTSAEGVQEKTLWAHIIYKYSDLVLPRLDYLTDVPLSQDIKRLTSQDSSSTPIFYPVSPD